MAGFLHFYRTPIRAMRHLLTPIGALFFSLGLAGLAALGFGPRQAIQLEATRLAMRAGLMTLRHRSSRRSALKKCAS